MFRRLGLSVFLLAVSSCAFAQFAPQYDPLKTLGSPGQDQDFLETAMKQTTAEIEWSKIAEEKGSTAEVKVLASQTVDAELSVASRLVEEAKSLKAKVPKGSSGKEKKESDKLNGLSGPQFDKEYLTALIKVQHDDVGNMREEMKESRDSSLQAFATEIADAITARNDKAKALLSQSGGK